MKIFPLFLLFCSFFLCTSTNINECKKLWGMNNEINGVTVSNIGIYMCIDDPLNIYSSILLYLIILNIIAKTLFQLNIYFGRIVEHE